MRHDALYAVLVRELCAGYCLRQCSDLIGLDDECTDGLGINRLLKPLRTGHGQIISYHEYGISQALTENLPTCPVVLPQTVFDRKDRVSFCQFSVPCNQLVAGKRRFFPLEKIFTDLPTPSEQGRSHVKRDPRRISGQAHPLYCLREHIEGFPIAAQPGRESAFQPDSDCKSTGCENILKFGESLRSPSD